MESFDLIVYIQIFLITLMSVLISPFGIIQSFIKKAINKIKEYIRNRKYK